MSAYLDKSQGTTFVYSNLFALYKQAKEGKLDSPLAVETPRVLKKGEGVVGEFVPGELKPKKEGERAFAVPMGVREAEEKAKKESMRPLANLQKNLNELASAHERLRFLLQELEALSKKK